MGKYVRLGIGIVAAAAAGLAVYTIIRGKCACAGKEAPPYAEYPEYSAE